jgi:hypothetical protein
MPAPRLIASLMLLVSRAALAVDLRTAGAAVAVRHDAPSPTAGHARASDAWGI